MIWTPEEEKKQQIKRNYWLIWLVILVNMIIVRMHHLLIVGWPTGTTFTLYCCIIIWWYFVARKRNTDNTFTSFSTDVRIRRQPKFLANWSTSSLKNYNSFKFKLWRDSKHLIDNGIELTVSLQPDQANRFHSKQLQFGFRHTHSQPVNWKNSFEKESSRFKLTFERLKRIETFSFW